MLPSVFRTFIERSPICVMAHAVLENLFQPERLDGLFERTAQRQYKRTLLNGTVVATLIFSYGYVFEWNGTTGGGALVASASQVVAASLTGQV